MEQPRLSCASKMSVVGPHGRIRAARNFVWPEDDFGNHRSSTAEIWFRSAGIALGSAVTVLRGRDHSPFLSSAGNVPLIVVRLLAVCRAGHQSSGVRHHRSRTARGMRPVAPILRPRPSPSSSTFRSLASRIALPGRGALSSPAVPRRGPRPRTSASRRRSRSRTPVSFWCPGSTSEPPLMVARPREESPSKIVHSDVAMRLPARLWPFAPTMIRRVHCALADDPVVRAPQVVLVCGASRCRLRLHRIVDVLPRALFSVAASRGLALPHESLLSVASEISLAVDRVLRPPVSSFAASFA